MGVYLIWLSYDKRINNKAVDRIKFLDVYDIYADKVKATDEMNSEYDRLLNDKDFMENKENLRMWIQLRTIKN